MISENLLQIPGMNAVQIVKKMAAEIQGGGGGQAFFATAGGKNPSGLPKALQAARMAVLEAKGISLNS